MACRFVSVTQQFNTTTSMRRLTLNVLLSFAQFEREVTSERIRDKIAASKRKGLWVGGTLPLGYHMKGRAEGRDRQKVMTLSTGEFIRRFLIHVLPSGFHRIRHYGLFASGTRADNIAQARRLLDVTAAQPEAGDTNDDEAHEPKKVGRGWKNIQQPWRPRSDRPWAGHLRSQGTEDL
jgi:hypothetical protein